VFSILGEVILIFDWGCFFSFVLVQLQQWDLNLGLHVDYSNPLTTRPTLVAKRAVLVCK